MSRTIYAAVLGAAILAAGTATGADDAAVWSKLLNDKSPSVVYVKAVLKLELSLMGQNQTEEQTGDFSGVLVDPCGLVMASSLPLSGPGRGMMPRMPGRNIDIKITPVSLKVIFPGDEKEYEAVLGATDSNLNLAFLRIKNLEGKKVQCVDFGDAAPVAIGQELVGVDRVGKGFDYAPFFGRATVNGELKQPRPMFSVQGEFGAQGLPLFTKEGKVVGALTMQQGVEGTSEGLDIGGLLGMLSGGGRGGLGVNVFLIPAATVKAVIDKAKPASEEALKKAAEKKAEGEEEKKGEEPGDEGEEE
jgi:S1-C subfamily serine protease